jgi:hypothetical protein
MNVRKGDLEEPARDEVFKHHNPPPRRKSMENRTLRVHLTKKVEKFVMKEKGDTTKPTAIHRVA